MTKQECDLAAALNVKVRRKYSESGEYRIADVRKVYPDAAGRERGKKAEIFIDLEDEQRRSVITYPENIVPADPVMFETLKEMQSEKMREETVSSFIEHKIRLGADELEKSEVPEEKAIMMYEEADGKYRHAVEEGYVNAADFYVRREIYRVYLLEVFGNDVRGG